MSAVADDTRPFDEWIADYLAAGWSLCGIEGGKKCPTYRGWQMTPLDADQLLIYPGVGLLLAHSGLCTLDVDNYEQAKPWLAECGVDLDAVLNAMDAVRFESGRQNRFKLLYRLSMPMTTKKVETDGNTILEFRCASITGGSVQDVLPPSRHPLTNQQYRWAYGEPLLGDWRNPPVIPPTLLAAWRELGGKPVQLATQAEVLPSRAVLTQDHMDEHAQVPTGTGWSIPPDELREILFKHFDPNCGHDEWFKVIAALHYTTVGSEEGLQLADKWSSTATRKSGNGQPAYLGFDHIKYRWGTLSRDPNKRLKTDAMFREKLPPAKADEFEVIEATEGAVVLPVPKAQHLCTDQANAERLAKRYGDKIISVAGTFYVWDGKRWNSDDALPQRFACELSNMVKAEIEDWEARVGVAQREIPDADMQAHLKSPRLTALTETKKGREFMQLVEALEALKKWSKKCEMKATQDAALGLLKKLLAVESNRLDSDPWLLNVENGTIDLRTGELRDHRASDFMTKLAPVRFDPAAKALRFEAFLAGIFAGDQGLIEFTQCWFGYCATGDVREQCLVIHYGAGSNGKSTLIGAITSALGDYATRAPTGLLTAKNSDGRHPAEIAKLRGARLVTASESEDGAKLREAFVKEITGGDQLTAREMYGEWFDFRQTHKLQMLTNHKPQIRGSDHGIWRRLRLLPYAMKFGTAEEVAAGKAACLKDLALAEALDNEKAGILNWIVQGAKRWHADGLQAPDVVLEASRTYREEQDRIGEFIGERCHLDRRAREVPSALYGAYRDWCHEVGIEYPVTQQRFLDELEQRVPGFGRGKSNGARYVTGIAVMPEDADLLA
jgi:P4 family phage/plasmid primase-like protien